MDYLFWTRVVCLLALPSLLDFTIFDIRLRWRKTGLFPTYWACVHVAAYCIFLAPSLFNSYRIATLFYVDVFVCIVFWTVAINRHFGFLRQSRKFDGSEQTGGR